MSEKDDFFPYPSDMLPWFYQNKRDLPWRKTKDAYAVWVSEIMLQQTRVEAAKEHYIRFMQSLPTVYDLAVCDDERLMKLWEGLGYYSRARNLKKCAVKVVEEYGGVFPSDKELLQKLPGIGEYTAGAVSSIAYDRKNPAIDGNVLRVCARVQGDFTPIDSPVRKKELYARLKSVYPEEAGDYTQSLMELGALVCLPETPRCGACPLKGKCVAERDGVQSALPVIPQKAEKKRSKLAVFVIETPQGIALRKRPKKGVLADMWEFVNVDITENEPPMSELLGLFGVKNYTLLGKMPHTHVFTHLIWDMTAYHVVTEEPLSLACYPKEKLKSEISLATAFRWCLQLLE
jgi:A/G-specific adenine glycosylase